MKVEEYRKQHKRSGLPELTERELQTYFVAELRKNGFLAWSTSSKSKAAGSKGVADVITFDLLSKEVKLYELKGPKTPISEEQERAIRLGAVTLVRDRDTADRIVRREI